MVSTPTTNKSIEKPASGDYANNWNVPVNLDWDIIDRAFGGVQVMNPTAVSGTVVLTTTQYQPQIIVVGTSISGTATLTANVNYQIPSGVGGAWTFYNNTTGSFTVTVSSGGGGTSVVLQQGYSTGLISDGTNIRISDTRPAVPAGSNTQIQYNNSGTLGASANLTFSGTQLNINQPANIGNARVQASSSTNSNIFSAEMPAGGPATGFVSAGSSTVTNYDHFGAYKIGSGTRLFGVASDGAITTASTIIAGSTIRSLANGFQFPDATVQATAAPPFPANGDGYQVLPSGLILQWGRLTVDSHIGTTYDFRTPFPTGCYSLTLTPTLEYTFNGGPYQLGVEIVSNSQFNVWNNNYFLLGFFWFAIGK